MQDNIFPLNWDKPMCKSCEAEGGKCRLKKSNSKEPETQCVKGTILHPCPAFVRSSFKQVYMYMLADWVPSLIYGSV